MRIAKCIGERQRATDRQGPLAMSTFAGRVPVENAIPFNLRRGKRSRSRRGKCIRRDTALANGEVIRRRFAELEVNQTEFVDTRGFTLRTFQRALAGERISRIALRKIAEALALSYEEVDLARGEHRSALAPDRRPDAERAGGCGRASSEGRAGIDGPSGNPCIPEIVTLAYELRHAFQRATECRHPPLREVDFAAVRRLIDRLRALDASNGHAFYYAAESNRWMGRREAGRREFLCYLDHYYKVFAAGEPGDLGLEDCYRLGHGYCRDRTVWVHHRLALDTEKSRAARSASHPDS
jgi:hypothetical protein